MKDPHPSQAVLKDMYEKGKMLFPDSYISYDGVHYIVKNKNGSYSVRDFGEVMEASRREMQRRLDAAFGTATTTASPHPAPSAAAPSVKAEAGLTADEGLGQMGLRTFREKHS